eukprot:TRINITY_DN33258_c0_g1_i1.p1 TRINITY_DN33258_c0_g1~~TRINITY_DN33258_c0_g1_i1.p1  ORF type:complete len:613 (+),score=68.98 TRINITY_DN33258_c0_g1_i1:34-1872(+)
MAIWEFQNNAGDWKGLEPCATDQLEAAYTSNPGSVVTLVCARKQYEFCLGSFTQKNCKTGTVRHLRRKDSRRRKLVYLMRHGQSEANASRINGRDILDPALTDLGRQQALAWASETSKWEVEQIMVSPLLRTIQTASLAFCRDTTPLQVTRSAREHGWHKPQNRGSSFAVLQERIAESCPHAIPRLQGLANLEKSHTFWDPDKEPDLPRQELSRRRKKASDYLVRKLMGSSAERLACVCHYNVVRNISGLRLPNADVALCTFELDASQWNLVRVRRLEVPNINNDMSMHISSPLPAHVSSTAIQCPESDAENENEPACVREEFMGSGSSGDDETDVQQHETTAKRHCKPPNSASVLIVGRSVRHGGAAVALLGGGMGRSGFRFCDFGGGLDGGPWRYGGRRHATAERDQPALGAFRELAEELLGLHGDEAREMAGALWRGAEVVGSQPVIYRRHLIYVCTAESLLPAAGKTCSPAESAIDCLAARFEPNSEVSCVALFPIDCLVNAASNDNSSSIVPISPIWGGLGRYQRHHFYSSENSLALERLRDLPSAEVTIENKYAVKPAAMQQRNLRTGRIRSAFRWECVTLRSPLNGTSGSLASLRETLSAWLATL